jgi:uncharacterized protein YraI
MFLKKKSFRIALTLLAAAVVLLSACTPAPTQDPAQIQTEAAQTVVADLTQAAPPPATEAPATEVPAPTSTPAPPGATPDPNIPVGVIPTPAPGEPAALANYNTLIMSGPGTNYVVYSVFVGSSTAKVIGKSEDGLWWAVSVPVAPNDTGWVDAAWVTVSNADGVPTLPTPPVPPTTEMVPPGPEDPQATALVNTYLRTGPAVNYPAYGVASAGATGRVIGKSEDGLWWIVRLDPTQVGDGYGWIEAQYTQATNVEDVQTVAMPDTAETIPPPPPPEGAPVATAVDYVNVRSGPGTNYLVYGVAPPGASAEVSGKSADGAWWQVKISTDYSPDGFGWVSADWVVTQNTENTPVVEAPPAPEPPPATPPPATTTAGCTLAGQNPPDGTVIGISQPFNTTWVLQNTGSAKWDESEFDLVFVGAVDNVALHTGPDIYDLNTTVEPGWTYNFTVPMLGPFGPGQFGEMWQLSQGNQVICQFYVYVVVE